MSERSIIISLCLAAGMAVAFVFVDEHFTALRLANESAQQQGTSEMQQVKALMVSTKNSTPISESAERIRLVIIGMSAVRQKEFIKLTVTLKPRAGRSEKVKYRWIFADDLEVVSGASASTVSVQEGGEPQKVELVIKSPGRFNEDIQVQISPASESEGQAKGQPQKLDISNFNVKE
jgi:hypothetical protein